MKQKKLILVKLIGIGNDESKRINNDDDDSDNDDDWKIECIDVIVRLVSITPGHVKLDWLPPPKVDRVNDNNSENNNE